MLSHVSSEENRQIGDKCRPRPDVGKHDGHFLARNFHRVHERLRDGVVAIDADAAQVQDGNGAKIDVETVPNITCPERWRKIITAIRIAMPRIWKLTHGVCILLGLLSPYF